MVKRTGCQHQESWYRIAQHAVVQKITSYSSRSCGVNHPRVRGTRGGACGGWGGRVCRMRSASTSDRPTFAAHLLPRARPGPAFGTCHRLSRLTIARLFGNCMAWPSPSNTEGLDAHYRQCFQRHLSLYKTPAPLRDRKLSCNSLFSLCHTIPKVYSVGPDSASRNWISIFQNLPPRHFLFDVCDSESAY
jgi:hypothetical protein